MSFGIPVRNGLGVGLLASATLATQRSGTVPVPSFTAAPLPATSFGQRNGDAAGTGQGDRRFVGPVLVNVFGDRNNANTAGGRQPGLIAFRAMYLPGNALSSGTTTSGPNQLQQIMGTSFSTANRSIRCSFAGPLNADTTARNRFAFFGRFANAVDLGGSSGVPIRTAEIDPFNFEPVMVFLRMNAAGRLQAFHALADGALVAGDFFDHATTAGMAATAAACSFGGAGGTAYQNYWSGSMSDFIQVNNVDVSDAQLSALARGEDPTAVLGAAPYAYYRMGGPTDLALTQGTAAYGALVAGGVAPAQIIAGTARPSTASGRTIQLLPEFDGFVHALHPTLVRAAANRAAVKALTASVVMRVRIAGSGSTHIWGRIRRSSDDAILVDWTRLTSSPVSAGVHDLELPGAPVGVDFYREVGAADGLNTSLDRERHRAGIVAMMIGQSQQDIMFVSAATGADTASSNGLVSIIRSYQTGATVVPAAAARLDRPGLFGGAVYELAKHWQEQADGIPLQLVCLAVSGTSRNDWMTAGADFWGGTAINQGRVPATVQMARRRFTMFFENWHTSDQGAINAGQLPALNDELYLGIGHTGTRKNFSQFPLVYPVWLAGVPFIRHRVISAGAPSEAARNSYQTARMIQREYYRGTGGSPSLLRDNATYMTALAIGPITEAPHQRTDDVRGNVYYGRWTAMGLARMAKLYSVNIETTLAAATRAGNVITLTTDRPNGGSLQTLVDNQTPVGFEVSEDGGTTWSRSNGTIAFTVARSGNTVTLTRGTGNWPANTQVRYLFGYPWDIPPGNDATAFAAETAAVDQMLGETFVNAPQGKVPLRPTVDPLVAA